MTYGDGYESLSLKFDREIPEDIEMMLEVIMIHAMQVDEDEFLDITIKKVNE